MKILVSASALVALSVCILVSCHKPQQVDPPSNEYTVTGVVQPVFGGNNLYLDTVYTLSNGVKIKVQTIKFYTSALTQNGSALSDYDLFDYGARGTAWFQKTITGAPSGTLSFNIGIDQATNHADPSGFASNSWLNSVNANDMYWAWSQGFIFAKIEGKADTIVDGTENFDLSFSYHLGGDQNFAAGITEAALPSQMPDNNHYKYSLKLDIQAFFENSNNPINVATENYTHSEGGSEALTHKVKSNFVSCISPL